ncbi:hypothetical protein AAEX63_14435 [Luteococcus sp. H138]|uniref:hypothetical protein n=1 Tax=unclassified Luteococcus TaxID=2639923 RepID=UPI00313CD438
MTIRVTAHGNRLAALGQTVRVEIDSDASTLSMRAPFYKRTIRLADITSAEAGPDDGLNRGPLNWFVVGRADSARGVRLNTGGKARVEIRTTGGARYQVVVDTLEQAETITAAVHGF